MQTAVISNLVEFLSKSVTPFHAVAEMSERLAREGFTELSEQSEWTLSRGKGYFVTRGGSALIAFRVPAEDFSACQMVASHCDSPGFKLKTNHTVNAGEHYTKLSVERYGGPIMSTWLDRPLGVAGRIVVRDGDRARQLLTVNAGEHYTKLSVERYGGPIMSTWLDRPLGVAGRIVVRDGDRARQLLVDTGRAVALIPNMPPHLDRGTADSHKYDLRTDLMPLFAEGKDKDLIKVLAERAGVESDSVLSHELFLYSRDRGELYGEGGEFLAAPRLDDLACVFASLEGIIGAKQSQNMAVHCVFNNEEIGSATREGAGADFLPRTLGRIFSVLGYSTERANSILAGSILLSADNGHALHPNHMEMFDRENSPVLNGGVVIKQSAGKKYMTDAMTYTLVQQLCERGQIPYQVYHNRSDIAGGSTLGCIAVENISVRMADLGLAQLAMHSTLETAGAHDVEHIVRLMENFYGSTIFISDNEFRIEQ